MAHLLPSDITKLDLGTPQSSEHATLGLLNAGLSNAYTVFHSVHWTNAYERRTVFGEIDFVIVNQAGDVLVIEQKNGNLEETESGLVKQYGREDKSVVGQINRSLNQVRAKFQYQHGRGQEPQYRYIFYCPDYQVRNLNAAGLDKDCIVDASNAAELCDVIQRLLSDGTPIPAQHKRVIDFFAQSYHLVLDIHARQTGLNRRYKELASDLVGVISNLEIDPFLLRVSGTAGSGKSLIAVDFYKRELAQGKRVLFLCYNRPLLDQLVGTIPTGGVVNTWLGFVQEVLENHGLAATPDDSGTFWDKRLEDLVDLGVMERWQFDSLIVDEGQDFEEFWWMVLKENFLRKSARVLWLEDPEQNVRGIDWQQREFPVTFNARKNCRSPYRIAQFIQEVLPFDFEVGNGLRGLGVGEHQSVDEDDLKSLVDRLVKKWITEGFGQEEIVVLTCRGLANTSLYRHDQIGNRDVRKYTEKYTDDGNQIYTSGNLLLESVRRFKGKQAPVVILVDVDLSEGERLLERQRLIYTGMTRATMRLEVLYAN